MSDARTNPEMLETPAIGEPIFPDDHIVEANKKIMPVTSVNVILPERTLTEVERVEMAVRLNERMLEASDYRHTLVMLKNAESVIGFAIEQVKEKALLEMQDKEETLLGTNLKTRRDVKYDYHNDSVLAAIDAKINDLKEQKKSRETLLKSIKVAVADAETGEIAEPASKLKDGQTIVVTLPK